MRNLLIKIAYNGTSYCGFQKQKNQNTIQKEIETALCEVLKCKTSIIASGRTDSGVHAKGQYANFLTSSVMPVQKFCVALNNKLPKDIRILDCREVDENFNARFSAKRKTYQYTYCLSEIISPFECEFVSKYKGDVNFDLLVENSKKLIGTHNFEAFCSANSSVTNFERTIYALNVENVNDKIIFTITGNGFLYNMVRIIVGTLMDIASRKIDKDSIDKMLITKKRDFGGKTAAPQGLCLIDVEYL